VFLSAANKKSSWDDQIRRPWKKVNTVITGIEKLNQKTDRIEKKLNTFEFKLEEIKDKFQKRFKVIENQIEEKVSKADLDETIDKLQSQNDILSSTTQKLESEIFDIKQRVCEYEAINDIKQLGGRIRTLKAMA